jgi:hypothetical protein
MKAARLTTKQKPLNKRKQLQADIAEFEQELNHAKTLIGCNIEQLQTAIVQFEQDLNRALNWPKDKPVRWDYEPYTRRDGTTRYRRVPKEARRPPSWKGARGYEFVSHVLSIIDQNKCSVAEAIRTLKSKQPDKWPEKQRDLERRFQENKEYWMSWSGLKKYLQACLADVRTSVESLEKVQL